MTNDRIDSLENDVSTTRAAAVDAIFTGSLPTSTQYSPQAGLVIWFGLVGGMSMLSLAALDPTPANQAFRFQLGYVIGTVFAHATAAAAWAALGPGRKLVRIPLSLVWVAAIPIAIAINISVHSGPASAVRDIAWCVFGQWVALQLPLAIITFGFGIRLQPIDSTHAESNRTQLRFGIRHLLITMSICGVFFAAGRSMVDRVAINPGGEFYIFVLLTIVGIILTLPLLLAALMQRWTAVGVSLALIMVAVVTAFELPLFARLGAGGPSKTDFISMNIASSGFILATALVVRLNGFAIFLKSSQRLSPGTSAFPG